MARQPKRAPAFQAPAEESEVVRLVPSEAPARTVRRGRKTAATVPDHRVGCTHLGAWVNEASARQFKAMAMERGVTIREAFVDMLNAEFARKGRPTIAD